MKLEAIDASTVRRAVETYLRHAYPDEGSAPEMDLGEGETAEDLIALFDDESDEDEGRVVGRYVLRLGNDRYPHMKLVLEENILKHEYAFAVDTHDDMRVSPDAPDYKRWNAVREHNAAVAEQVERAWRDAGIPTVRDIQQLIGKVEKLTEKAQSVLVVDDEPAIREAICHLLERAGLKVRTAENGRAALEKVAEEAPSLILMDYQMPEMDGVACCEALKGDAKTSDIPVLLATRSQVDLASLTYADGFLVKPYRQDVLFSLVRKLLS